MHLTKRTLLLTPLVAAALFVRARTRPGRRGELVVRAFRPIMAWAARRTLVGRTRSRQAPQLGRFTRGDVDRLLADAWRRYNERAPHLPARPTVGSRLNLRLACLTVALFRSLLDQGVERAYAIELVSDINWTVYAWWGRSLRLLVRLGVRRPTNVFAGRVRSDGTVPLAFPFNPPGYVAKQVPIQDGVAFDVVRCAVADYFRSEGAADLCLASWCNLDYPLGEMLGFTLRRTTTLVEGANQCDFRWMVAGRGETIGTSRGARLSSIRPEAERSGAA